MPAIYEARDYGTRRQPAIRAIDLFAAKTAAYTAKADEAGTCFTNRGAGGSVTVTLPAPTAVSIGDRFRFAKIANQNLVVNAGVANGFRTLTGVGVTLTNSTSADYGTLEVESDGTEWLVTSKVGTWALA